MVAIRTDRTFTCPGSTCDSREKDGAEQLSLLSSHHPFIAWACGTRIKRAIRGSTWLRLVVWMSHPTHQSMPAKKPCPGQQEELHKRNGKKKKKQNGGSAPQPPSQKENPRSKTTKKSDLHLEKFQHSRTTKAKQETRKGSKNDYTQGLAL